MYVEDINPRFLFFSFLHMLNCNEVFFFPCMFVDIFIFYFFFA